MMPTTPPVQNARKQNRNRCCPSHLADEEQGLAPQGHLGLGVRVMSASLTFTLYISYSTITHRSFLLLSFPTPHSAIHSLYSSFSPSTLLPSILLLSGKNKSDKADSKGTRASSGGGGDALSRHLEATAMQMVDVVSSTHHNS